MELTELHERIDQTGIERIFGAVPVPLPRLSATAEQVLRDEGLPGLEQRGYISVDDGLKQQDSTLAQAQQVLSAPDAVVRAYVHHWDTRLAPNPRSGPFWAFVQGGRIVQLVIDIKQRGLYRLISVPDSGTLLLEIEALLPISSMPSAAHARAVLDQGDAQDVYDLSQGSGMNVATEIMESDGLSEEEARVAFDAIRTSSLSGRVSFMAVSGKNVALTWGIAVGQDGDEVWMAYANPSQSDGLVLETVMKGAFHQQLEDGWSSLDLT